MINLHTQNGTDIKSSTVTGTGIVISQLFNVVQPNTLVDNDKDGYCTGISNGYPAGISQIMWHHSLSYVSTLSSNIIVQVLKSYLKYCIFFMFHL